VNSIFYAWSIEATRHYTHEFSPSSLALELAMFFPSLEAKIFQSGVTFMQPVLISNPLKMVLPGVGPVAVPIGEPVAQLKASEIVSLPDKQVEAGVWECSPGVWSRQVKQAEFCHFIAGHCFFTPEGGQPMEIRAGDAIFFPPNSKGTWDVKETVRKTYVTFMY
jgi:uncharacterized protein